ncbi:MAG: ribosome maturation factor RimM [Eubacteriales bacterium]
MAQNLLETGEIVNTHGTQGEVKIRPWADVPEFLTEFDELYIDDKAVEIEYARVHKDMVLAKLAGVNSMEEAMKLRGKVVKIDRDEVELEDGTVFIADIIGLPVFVGDEKLGTLKDVLTLPANDVYVVRGKKEYLIPAVSDFLEEVNMEEKFIRVRLIEGMDGSEI